MRGLPGPRTTRASGAASSRSLAYVSARLTGRAATELAVVNEARKLYLGMLPVRELTGAGGLGAVIAALNG